MDIGRSSGQERHCLRNRCDSERGLRRRLRLRHPGHPLMLSMSDMILEQHANLLRQGAILVDPSDEGTEPWLLFLLTHEVKSGDGTVLSKRLQFVRVAPDGKAGFAGWALFFAEIFEGIVSVQGIDTHFEFLAVAGSVQLIGQAARQVG